VKHAIASGARHVAATAHAARVDDFAAGKGGEALRWGNTGGKEFERCRLKDLLGTPSQPVQVALLPPHTPHASRARVVLTKNDETLLRTTLEPPDVSAM
jgi:hypothetical protein